MSESMCCEQLVICEQVINAAHPSSTIDVQGHICINKHTDLLMF
jgi:hypothetical protein